MGSLRPTLDLHPEAPSFATGLLNELVAALRELADGELLALHGPAELPAGPRALGALHREHPRRDDAGERDHAVPRPQGRTPLVRRGAGGRIAALAVHQLRLQPRLRLLLRALLAQGGAQDALLEDVQRAAREAPRAGVRELLVTGGEPFLRQDIAEVLLACAGALPTTVLTNGLLFAGKRRLTLRELPRDRIVFQISLDSPTSALHDQHRGQGTWEKARAGIAAAREEGFRVRLASTVSDARAEEEFRAFVLREGIPEQDCVLRRVALRGFADEGVALSRADLVPEVTLTASGIYWHPVGATDDDFFVTSRRFPLSEAIQAVQLAFEDERRFATALASVFRCA